MTLHFGTGQLSAAHCLACSRTRAQRRLQMPHPPLALVVHPPACLSIRSITSNVNIIKDVTSISSVLSTPRLCCPLPGCGRCPLPGCAVRSQVVLSTPRLCCPLPGCAVHSQVVLSAPRLCCPLPGCAVHSQVVLSTPRLCCPLPGTRLVLSGSRGHD
jgi:hypothetical protein